MGRSVWIWAFFILSIYVCRAYAVSAGRNHSGEKDHTSVDDTWNHLSDSGLGLLVAFSAVILVVIIISGCHAPLSQNFARIKKVTNNANHRKEQVGLKDRKKSDCFPDSSPPVPELKYITKVEGYFNSSGGELSAAPDSDVKIVIGNGAIGGSQLVFFRVVDNEKELLRDIPVGPDETLISPVIECGPHDISISKPLEIIIPHYLYMGKAEEKWIGVYRTDPGPIKWEKIPNELEKNDLSKAWFTVKEDSIHIKTMTFCFWSIFCRGGTRKKRAIVFANKPNPGSDLVYLRFYTYSDNGDSRRRVENHERMYFESSRPSKEKPFKVYDHSKKIIVRLEDLKEGWELDKTTDGEKKVVCGRAHGGRLGSQIPDTCEFAVKPVKGGAVNGFCCNIKFQQEGNDVKHIIYVNPGFTPLKLTNNTNLREDQVGLKDRKEGDCSPESFPAVPVLKYITQVEGYFGSSGGELSAAPDSDVRIVIGNGAVGDKQFIFLREVDDETKLLQNIPVGPDETLISTVIECGPHDISPSKPLKIIVPHCLDMGEVEKECISVYRTDPGCIKWENIPNELEKDDLSKAWFIAKEDSIHIMTMKFCYWCIFCRGGPRKKRARVFANKPDPNCDLIYLRFYAYGDNEDSRKRVEEQEKRYTESPRPSIEKPFKMYNNSKKIIVRIDDLKEGWELDTTTDGEKEFLCHSFRCKDSCDFQVKPIAGGEGTEAFSCNIKFQQEGRDAEHTFFVSPGFELVAKLDPVNVPRQNSTGAAGCPSSSAPDESDTGNLEEQSKPPKDSKLLSSLLDNRTVLDQVRSCLNKKTPGLGDYRDVCSYFKIDRNKVRTDFQNHEDGPTGALLDYLAAAKPQLTIAEFVSVVRETTGRDDVPMPLEEYDNQ